MHHQGGTISLLAQKIIKTVKSGECSKVDKVLKDASGETNKKILKANKKEIAKLDTYESKQLMEWINGGFCMDEKCIKNLKKKCHKNFGEITGGNRCGDFCGLVGGNRCGDFCGLVGGKKKMPNK